MTAPAGSGKDGRSGRFPALPGLTTDTAKEGGTKKHTTTLPEGEDGAELLNWFAGRAEPPKA